MSVCRPLSGRSISAPRAQRIRTLHNLSEPLRLLLEQRLDCVPEEQVASCASKPDIEIASRIDELARAIALERKLDLQIPAEISG